MINEREARRKGEHADGRIRCNSTYDTDTYDLLDKLSMALGITPTALQTKLVKYCLQNESMVNYLQDLFKRRSRFRVIPSKVNGKMYYALAEKSRQKNRT